MRFSPLPRVKYQPYLQGVDQPKDGENEQPVAMLAGLVPLVIGRDLDVWPRADKLGIGQLQNETSVEKSARALSRPRQRVDHCHARLVHVDIGRLRRGQRLD